MVSELVQSNYNGVGKQSFSCGKMCDQNFIWLVNWDNLCWTLYTTLKVRAIAQNNNGVSSATISMLAQNIWSLSFKKLNNFQQGLYQIKFHSNLFAIFCSIK